jgi:TonB family protein
MRAAVRPIFLLLFLLLFTASSAAAQEALVSVRELYASAEYEEALTTLGRLRGETAINDSLELDHYRVLCLIALGRSTEADEVIETIVKSDPLYEPGADAAPRIRAAYSSVRRRVSPAVARSLYTEGKAAFDRKAFEDAADKLELVLRVIDMPDAGDSSELADLRTLAAGFLDLSRASLPSKLPAASLPVANNAPPPAPPPVLPPPTDPVVVRQELPRWSTAVAGNLFEAEFKGMIEVEIDEQGDVVSASIVEPIHPAYDKLLLKAAHDWKYEPARRNGQPVKVRKRVDIVLRPR